MEAISPLGEQVGIGGAVAVALVGVVLRFLPPFMRALREQRHGNGNGHGQNKSGNLTPHEWEGRFRKLNTETREEILSDMRKMMDSRDSNMREELRRIFRDEVERITRGLFPK